MNPGAIIAKKYRLEAPLARGGMGAVWTARHVALGHAVAVKFLDPRLAGSSSFVARFEREARAAATAQSPHIVRVHDFGFEEGTPYLVMELLRGEDLRSRIRRMGRLPLSVTAGILVQVGKGLRRAHEVGIVHRDIKPGNIFLARVDGDDGEIVKILDFGIAKENDVALEEHTKTGELVGSPHYVSPEQARGERDLDHRSDVWSTGVIAYRMVTGCLPFPGEGLGQVLSKVLTADPPKVGTQVPGLPASLDGFFAKALAKKKEERFQSIRELVDAFVELVRVDGVEEEDSVGPASWSTIIHVSVPPPAPNSMGVSGRTTVEVKGAAGKEMGKTSLSAVDSLPRSVRRAQLIEALIASEAGRNAGSLVAGEADGEPADKENPGGEGKRDSLVPSMAAKIESRPPVVRFRWAAAGALALSAMVTTGVAWMRDHAGSGSASASATDVESAVGSWGVPPPPPPPGMVPLPGATLGVTAAPPASAAASGDAATKMPADATAKAMAPGAGTGTARAGNMAVPAATGTRRKWGF